MLKGGCMVKVNATPFGLVAVDIDGSIVEFEEFPKDAKKVAEMLESKEALENFVKKLKEKGYAVEIAWINPLEVAERLGINKKDALEFIRKVAIELSRIRVKKSIGKDWLAIQAISALDDLNVAINMLVGRLREWYGFYYPEFKEEDHRKFAKFVVEGKRGESMGIEIDEKDLKVVQELAKTLLEMYKLKNKIESYLDKIMQEVAPNIRSLVGSNLGARLLEKAGGLEKLAKLPASTIQVLGAEKALFKHLQKGSPPPKHGVLFQHPLISRAPKKKRGKIARALAAKLAIAARTDYYTRKLNPKIREEFEARVKEVMENDS